MSSGSTGRRPRPTIRQSGSHNAPNPGHSRLNDRLSHLEQELKQSQDATSRLKRAMVEKEESYSTNLEDRARAFKVANETLRQEVDQERSRTKNFKEENSKLRSEIEQLKLSIDDFKNELNQGRSKIKQVEKNYDDTLKKRLIEMEERLRRRFEKNRDTVKVKSRDLVKELGEWKERAEKAESAKKHFKNKLDEQSKEHKNKVVMARRSTQHALRSAVLKAEERKRETLAYHQEQSRVLERELRQLKSDYEEKFSVERENSQKEAARLSDELTKLRRETAMIRNESSQVKKLWRQAQSELKESEGKLKELKDRYDGLQEEHGKLAQAASENEAAIRAEQRKSGRLEEMLESHSKTRSPESTEAQVELEKAEIELREQQDEIDRLTTMYQAAEYSKALETEALRDAQTQLIKLETQYKIALGEIKKRHREEHAKFEAERVVWQQKAEKAQRNMTQLSDKLTAARQEKSEHHKSALDTQKFLTRQRGRETQLEGELATANTELKELRERSEKVQRRFLVELSRLRKHYEDKLADQAAQALDSLQKAVNVAQQRFDRADTARKKAENHLEKVRADVPNSADPDALLISDEEPLPEADLVNQLLAEIDHNHGLSTASSPRVTEENQRLKGTIEDLRERLSRAENQFAEANQKAEDERSDLQETLAEQRKKNEDLANAIDDWKKSKKQKERMEFHRDSVSLIPTVSKSRHQADHMIYNQETLLMLCKKLEQEWLPEGFKGDEGSDQSAVSTIKSGTLSAQVCTQLESLEERLGDMFERSETESTRGALKELRGLLGQERQRLDQLHQGRQTLIEKVENGTKDLAVLIKLAELVLADRRIHSEMVRVTVAVDAIDFALRTS